MKVLILAVLITFVFNLNYSVLYSQIENFRDEFILPIDFSPVLTGGFGEPRTRHFHMGVDFRTYRNDRPIYAVADGHVARISVSPFGHGLALYIDHPNGFTSVYAHLNSFRNDINEFLKNMQYEYMSYAVDTGFSEPIFSVSQGEIIAFSGNTGYSYGPHLHFELRDTETQDAYNVLNTIYDIKDNVKPAVFGIVVYPMCYTSQINGENKKRYINVTRQTDGNYRLSGMNPILGGETGFGVDYVDRMTGTHNRYGAKEVKLFIDNELYYHSSVTRLSHANQIQKNSVFDYEYYITERKHVQKLFREPNNSKSIFKILENDGIFIPVPGQEHNVLMQIVDYYYNTSEVEFTITGAEKDLFAEEPDNLLRYDEFNILISDGCRIEIDPGTLFKDEIVRLRRSDEGSFSPVYSVGKEAVALKKPVTLYIFPDENAWNYKEKLFVRCKHNNRMIYLEPEFLYPWIICNPRSFGEFTVIADTVPPEIKPKNIRNNANMTGRQFIEFEISDDISGIASYNMYINNVWVLARYEPKDKTVRYYFDEKVPSGRNHQLVFIVKDRAGNVGEYRGEFYY